MITRREQRKSKNKIVPVEDVNLYPEDEPSIAIERQVSDSSVSGIPVAENYDENISMERSVERPYPIVSAEVIGEEKACCLPWRTSRNCRICPETPEEPQIMPKRGGKRRTKRIKKRKSKKQRVRANKSRRLESKKKK